MLQELIKISKYAGMREDLVQAGGGNTSVKISKNEMLIKASGCQLSEVSKDYGYSKVCYSQIAEYLSTHQDKVISEKDGKEILSSTLLEGMRPSIETFLHSVTDTVTMHTHAVVVNVLAARKNGMEILRQLFPEALFIDYATPGVDLAQKYFKQYTEQMADGKKGNIIFLKNHGLIISGRSAEEVISLNEVVINKIADFIQMDNSSYRDNYLLYCTLKKYDVISDDKIVYLSHNTILKSAIQKYKSDAWKIAFCPDCLVYCGRKIFVAPQDMDKTAIDKYIEVYGEPVAIVFRDNIFIVADNIKKAKEIESVLEFSATVNIYNEGHDLECLSLKEQGYLLNWESEKYRKNMK